MTSKRFNLPIFRAASLPRAFSAVPLPDRVALPATMFLRPLERQPFATLGAPTVDYHPTGLGGHAFAKSTASDAFDLARLIRSFHVSFPLSFQSMWDWVGARDSRKISTAYLDLQLVQTATLSPSSEICQYLIGLRHHPGLP